MAEINRISGEIGQRIYDRRKELGITQEYLAELTDTTPQSISNYERGERELRASTIIKMATALNTSTDFLLTGKDSSFLDVFDNIPETKQTIIKAIVDKCIKLLDWKQKVEQSKLNLLLFKTILFISDF